ncbi:MAG: protein kinase [Myxococcales bacterium]
MATQYIALGPMLSGEGSRAFIGLRIADGEASPCALIWVPEATLHEPEKIEQLKRDTARAAGLVHPNIVRVYGLVEIEPSLARVVEFADAESLRKVLDVTKRLPTPFAALAACDAALGVQYAHVAGNEDGTPLVHGDLRPETMLTSYNGRTKVSGYGALNVAPKEMGGKRVMGRRLHCAPEQIIGGREAVTVTTDVYLLGLILYECLTGSIPFADDKNFDKAVLAKQLPLLNSELVPPKLRPVIGKAMAKKGPQRYASVQEFRAAVEEAVELPDHADFAEFLSREFKVDDARLARQKVIDNGMEEWVLKKGFRIAPAPPPPPRRKPKPVEPPPAPAQVAPAPALPAPVASAPAPAPAQVAPAVAAAAPAQPAASPAPAPIAPAPAAPAAAPPPAPAPVRADPHAVPAVQAAPAKPARSPWVIVVPVMVAGLGVAFWLGKRLAAAWPAAGAGRCAGGAGRSFPPGGRTPARGRGGRRWARCEAGAAGRSQARSEAGGTQAPRRAQARLGRSDAIPEGRGRQGHARHLGRAGGQRDHRRQARGQDAAAGRGDGGRSQARVHRSGAGHLHRPHRQGQGRHQPHLLHHRPRLGGRELSGGRRGARRRQGRGHHAAQGAGAGRRRQPPHPGEQGRGEVAAGLRRRRRRADELRGRDLRRVSDTRAARQ